MSRHGLTKVLAAVAVLAAGFSAAHAYEVEEVGSLFVGGTTVTLTGLKEQKISVPGGEPISVDPNGDYHTGQMYAQFVKLAHPAAKYPLLMWHTGGITGASWETKPDGNPGWQQFFLRHGHSVYVSDAVERGRASFSRIEIYKSEPVFRDKRDGWEIFRIGAPGSYRSNPVERKAYPDTKFPLAAYDRLQMEAVARWVTTGDATQSAYNALVARVCPCVIMAHGQAGLFAFRASLAMPDKVKAIVAIEPAFAPKADHPELGRLKGTPHLWVWGDNIDSNPTWVDHVKGVQPYHASLVANGISSTWMDLPAQGIKGNTHMTMMDTNSDIVAAKVEAWMVQQGLVQPGAVAQAVPAAKKTPVRKAQRSAKVTRNSTSTTIAITAAPGSAQSALQRAGN
jgi:hypothetical protein